MPASSRRRERAPSAAISSSAVSATSPQRIATRSRSTPKVSIALARKVTPTSRALAASAAISGPFSTMWANGWPGSPSPAKVRNPGLTASPRRLSVTTMSRIGCAPAATARHASIVSSRRRAPAAIAEARASSRAGRPSAGSATTTLKSAPRPWRNATASASPAKPAPAMTTSAWLVCSVIILFPRATYPAPAPGLQGAQPLNLFMEHDLFRPAFARRSVKPNDEQYQGLRAGGKPVPTFRDHALEPPHVVCPRRNPRYSRPRAAGSEPVPWPQPAGAVATRVRRTGDRAGAGRRVPYRRGPAAPFAPRLFPAARRSGGADHLRGRPHPRRQELHHPARGRNPARACDFHHGGVVPWRRGRPHAPGADAGRTRAGSAAERDRYQEPGARLNAGAGAPLLRARAPDRAASGRIRALSRQEDRQRAFPRVDSHHRQPAGRSRHSSVRARLRVRPHLARRSAGAARAFGVRPAHHRRQPRSRAVVPPPIPRRSMAALRAGQPESLGRAWLLARAHLHARGHPRRFGRPGGLAAGARQALSRQACWGANHFKI